MLRFLSLFVYSGLKLFAVLGLYALCYVLASRFVGLAYY